MNLKKNEIRKIALNNRKTLSSSEIEVKSKLIIQNFINSISLQEIKAIHIFLPIIKHNEINTFPLIEYIKTNFPQIKIIVPKVIENTNEMLALELTHDCDLIENKWGIPEPCNETIIKPSQIDLIILPLLGFDLQGNRVGYGKGFYDRFLTQCKTNIIKVGFCIDKPFTKITDIEVHDYKLDYVVIPEKIYKIEH